MPIPSDQCVKHGCTKRAVCCEPSDDCPGGLLCEEHRTTVRGTPGIEELAFFRPGDRVRLIEKPDGYTSKDYPVHVDGIYTVHDQVGSTLYVTTDEVGELAWIGKHRFTLEEEAP